MFIPVARVVRFKGTEGSVQLNPPNPVGQTRVAKEMVPLKSSSETEKKKSPDRGVLQTMV